MSPRQVYALFHWLGGNRSTRDLFLIENDRLVDITFRHIVEHVWKVVYTPDVLRLPNWKSNKSLSRALREEPWLEGPKRVSLWLYFWITF